MAIGQQKSGQYVCHAARTEYLLRRPTQRAGIVRWLSRKPPSQYRIPRVRLAQVPPPFNYPLMGGHGWFD
ncbi:hypothetical protein MRX96_009778 [Rhipicephalus microplus]